jgi:micrococcal nuclease
MKDRDPMPFDRAFLVALVGAALLPACPAAAREVLAGPVPARVVDIVDGDTLTVRAHIWLGQEVETRVRLIGIDTPELRGGCDSEREQARAARAALSALVAGRTVTLRDIEADVYGGRVLARLDPVDGVDVAAALVDGGLARPYDGRTRRAPWCAG